MATLKRIHEAISSQLETVQDLRPFPYPPQGASPPIAFPILTGWEAQAMGRAGLIQADFEVIVLTAETTRPQDGYRDLLKYIDHEGASSIFTALWDGNDPAAGTFVGLTDTRLDTTMPGSFRLLGLEEMDAYQMYGGAITVRVLTKGST